MRGWRVVALGLLAVGLCVAATFATGTLVSDLGDPERACYRQRPLFDGDVEDAETRWPPPLVRCDFVDGSTDTVWSWGGLALLLGLDVVALVTAVAAIRSAAKYRRRRGTPEHASLAGELP